MAKLILRQACYTGISDVKTKNVKYGPEHKELIKEHNQKMDSKRNKMINSYDDIKNYICN